MAALMASSSAFAGVKVQARVTAKNARCKSTIMASGAGPKRVSTQPSNKYFIFLLYYYVFFPLLSRRVELARAASREHPIGPALRS